MNGGEIKVVMTLDDKDFTVKTVKAGETIRQFKSHTDSAHGSIKKLEGGLGSAAAKFRDLIFAVSIIRYAFSDFNDIVLALPTAFLKAGGEMERMTALMKGLSKETDVVKKEAEALANTKFIFQFAQNAPFELKTLTDTFVKMKAAGIDPTNGSMQALVDSVAKFGGTDEQLKRASVAIQQMAGKGVISMEELRQQLGEAVPNAVALMARGMGMSMGDFVKQVSKGTVEARSALAKMFIQMEIDAAGSAKKMMTTIPGMLNQLKTEWELFKIKVSEGGMGDVFKSQIKELIDYLQSPKGQKFAQEVGEGMKDLFKFVVAVKDGFVALWPIIKVVGEGMLLYFGGQALKSGWASINSLMDAQKLKFAELHAARQAGYIAEAEHSTKRRNAAIIDEQVQSKAFAREATAFKKLSDQKISGFKEERAAASASLNDQVSKLQAFRAVEQKMLMEKLQADASANATYKRLGEFGGKNVAADAEATSARIANNLRVLDQERTSIEKSIASHKAKIEVLGRAAQAENAATFATSNAGRTAQAALVAQRNYITTLGDHITAQNKLADSVNKGMSALLGFGRTLMSMVGWGIAVSVAMTAISFLYEKIAGSAKRAADEIDRLQRIRNGQATGLDLRAKQEEVDGLKAQILDYDRSMENYNKTVAGKLRPQLVNPEQEALRAKLRTASQNLEMAKATIDSQTSDDTGDRLSAALRESVEKQSLRSEISSNLFKIDKQILDADQASNTLLGAKLRDQQKTLSLEWIKEKIAITKDAYEKALPKAKLEGGDALLRFEAGYAKYIEELQGKIATINFVAKPVGGTKPDLGAARAANKESPMLKILQDQQADMAKAKEMFDQLTGQAKSISENAEYLKAIELLKKVAKGDFDIGPSKNNPAGVQPGKKDGVRLDLIERFQDFVKSGMGTVQEFIDTLGFLDVAMAGGEEKLKTYIKTAIAGAGPLAALTNVNKGLAEIQQINTGITSDLALSTEELNVGISLLPNSVEALQRKLKELGVELKLTGADLERFNKDAANAVSNKLLDSVTKESVTLKAKAAKADFANIINVRDRQAAAHALEMKEIDEVEKKEIDTANGNAATIAGIRALAAQKRKTEITNFTRENRTELQKMLDDWTDVTGQIDKTIAKAATGWVDSIMKFVETGKFSLTDMVKSFVNDIARIQIQTVMAPFIKASSDWLTGALGGLLGRPDAGASTEQQMPVDRIKNAMRVTMVDQASIFGAGGGPENGQAGSQPGTAPGFFEQMWAGFKDGVDKVWGFAKGLFADIGSFFKADFGRIIADIGGGFMSIIRGMGSGLMDIFNGLMSGGGDWMGELVKIGMAFLGFKDGGIMSSMGSASLKRYAGGGIANSPQLAMFGEGSMNEAYVPLPDGRSIPVTMQMQGGTGAPTNVVVNVINQTTQDVTATQQGAPRFDGKQMVLDVVLSAATQPGPFRDGMRGMMGAN